MPFRYTRLIKFALKFIGAVVAIVLVVSILVSLGSGGDFVATLIISLFIGGVAVMFVGALVGAGLSERSIHNAAYMTGGHHSNYYERVFQERYARRDDQFYFMLLMTGAGLILIFLAFLLG